MLILFWLNLFVLQQSNLLVTCVTESNDALRLDEFICRDTSTIDTLALCLLSQGISKDALTFLLPKAHARYGPPQGVVAYVAWSFRVTDSYLAKYHLLFKGRTLLLFRNSTQARISFGPWRSPQSYWGWIDGSRNCEAILWLVVSIQRLLRRIPMYA